MDRDPNPQGDFSPDPDPLKKKECESATLMYSRYKCTQYIVQCTQMYPPSFFFLLLFVEKFTCMSKT
jgi:hypothetical protein